jgi:hypothetical protein
MLVLARGVHPGQLLAVLCCWVPDVEHISCAGGAQAAHNALHHETRGRGDSEA